MFIQKYKELIFPLIFIITIFLTVRQASGFSLHQDDGDFTFTPTSGDGVPEGYMIIEGDIMVPENYYNLVSNRAIEGSIDTNLWSEGIIPFSFDGNVNETNRNRMLEAMQDWENIGHIDFITRTTQIDYILIKASVDTNSSSVGRVGGEQLILITSWTNHYIIMHELAHALGMWHEHSRLDRDNYIQINDSNIEEDKRHNFDKSSGSITYPKQTYGLTAEQTYDYDSIMHYRQDAFSKNGDPTIRVLPPNQSWQSQIGQRDHISYLDNLTMSFLYPEENWIFVDEHSSEGQKGTFFQPFQGFNAAYNVSTSESIIFIQPGNYLVNTTIANPIVLNKPITLQAPLGHVTIGGD